MTSQLNNNNQNPLWDFSIQWTLFVSTAKPGRWESSCPQKFYLENETKNAQSDLRHGKKELQWYSLGSPKPIISDPNSVFVFVFFIFLHLSTYLPTFFFFFWTSLSWLFTHKQTFRDVSPLVFSVKRKPLSKSKKQKSKTKPNKWATSGNDTVWVKAIHFKIFKLVSAIWPRDLSPELGEVLAALSRRQGCGQKGQKGGGWGEFPSGPWLKRPLSCHGKEQVLRRLASNSLTSLPQPSSLLPRLLGAV